MISLLKKLLYSPLVFIFSLFVAFILFIAILAEIE